MAHQALGQRQLGATTHCSGTGSSSSSRPLAPVVARRQLRAGRALQQQQVPAVQQQLQLQLRSAVCAAASKLEDVPLFSDSSVVVKPAEGASSSSSSGGQAAAGGVKLADVPLNSEVRPVRMGGRGCVLALCWHTGVVLGRCPPPTHPPLTPPPPTHPPTHTRTAGPGLRPPA